MLRKDENCRIFLPIPSTFSEIISTLSIFICPNRLSPCLHESFLYKTLRYLTPHYPLWTGFCISLYKIANEIKKCYDKNQSTFLGNGLPDGVPACLCLGQNPARHRHLRRRRRAPHRCRHLRKRKNRARRHYERRRTVFTPHPC